MKKKNFRRGLTVIELMTVILVLGIMATMIIYGSTAAITTAKVTKIISDLKQITKAANSWYLDNYTRIISPQGLPDGFKIVDTADGKTKTLNDYFKAHPDEITKYIDGFNVSINQGKSNFAGANNSEYYASVGGYSVYYGHSNVVCYGVYKISEKNDSTEQKILKEKLKAKAHSEGLLSYKYGSIGNVTYADGSVKNKSTSTINEYNGVDANIFMLAFTLKDPEESYKR